MVKPSDNIKDTHCSIVQEAILLFLSMCPKKKGFDGSPSEDGYSSKDYTLFDLWRRIEQCKEMRRKILYGRKK